MPDTETLTGRQLDALPFAPGWDDGRTGFEWARFDAVVDRARFLRAEVTWGDNSDELPPESIKSNADMVFDKPELRLETNYPDPADPGQWMTLDSTAILLTQALAAEIIAAPPADLLRRYPVLVAGLKFHTPEPS